MSMARKASRHDKCIARNIKKMRLSADLTQMELASGIGVTYQQIQKYEQAMSRVSAGRLWDISQIFEVPVESLFEGCK